jgi:hypothetical protein
MTLVEGGTTHQASVGSKDACWQRIVDQARLDSEKCRDEDVGYAFVFDE